MEKPHKKVIQLGKNKQIPPYNPSFLQKSVEKIFLTLSIIEDIITYVKVKVMQKYQKIACSAYVVSLKVKISAVWH